MGIPMMPLGGLLGDVCAATRPIRGTLTRSPMHAAKVIARPAGDYLAVHTPASSALSGWCS
jgi:hypothetical protein